MDPGVFYGEMLDYVEQLFCALNPDDVNRGAVITFSNVVTTQVQLKQYTQEEWFEQIETIRQDDSICCHCCTPTAEAFNAARVLLNDNPPPTVGGVQVLRIVFTITDGDPWQNKQVSKNSGLPPLSPTDYYLWPQYGAGQYRFVIVPDEALKLKNLDANGQVRIMLVGVPNKHGQPPDTTYFSGKPNPQWGKGTTQCIVRGQRPPNCAVMSSPPFPIVSLPIDSNLFNPGTWDVGSLIQSTVDDLCQVLPTQSPTPQPTTAHPSKVPSLSPTHKPTTGSPSKVPSLSPNPRPTSQKPSKGPSLSPNPKPTSQKPSKRPTLSPTTHPSSSPSSTPTNHPSMDPTVQPSHAPSSHPTPSPTFAPTNHPTKFPTPKPTKRPTSKPSRVPTGSPSTSGPSVAPTVKPPFDGLDLYVC